MQIQLKPQFSFKKYLKSTQAKLDKPIQDSLELLLSITSSCLLNQMRYYDNDDFRRQIILAALQTVEQIDPQFIPQLTLYLRRQLGIRTTSNFMIAYMSCSTILSVYLQKYFNHSTVLPADLIQICQFVQIIHLLKQGKPMNVIKQQNAGDKFEIRRNIYLPNQLKKVLIKKINGFTEYQLGKYCSDGKRKSTLDAYLAARKGTLVRKIFLRRQRAKKLKNQNEDVSKVKTQVIAKKVARGRIMKKKHQPKQLNPLQIKAKAIQKTFLTMKDLISLLHIKPTLLTSSIVGAKYPKTKEQYQRLYGQGFDETKAGKRMKLKIPQTWETQLSKKGNSKQIWQKLITNNSIPYLAGIRNLRNIIKSNVSQNLINKFANFLSDAHHIHKNKTTPFQYYSAISQLDNINKKKGERQRQRQQFAKQEIKQQIQIQFNQIHINIFKNALKKALTLSMDNVQQIKGRTSIFMDVSGSMKSPLSGGKKFGSIRQCFQLSLLMGLMINKKCQKCDLYIFSSPNGGECYIKVNQLINGQIQSDMTLLSDLSDSLGGSTDFPTKVITQYLNDKIKVDNFIILSDMMISTDSNDGYGFIDQIAKYRSLVNPNLKVFSVDLKGYSQTQALRNDFKEQNFIRIYGANTSILRFITAKQGNQIEYIKSFAKKFIES